MKPYLGEADELPSRTTSFQEGEDDEDIITIVTPTTPTATYTTRDRARQLNYQVLPFLGNDFNVHENMMLPKLDTFVWPSGADRKLRPWPSSQIWEFELHG